MWGLALKVGLWLLDLFFSNQKGKRVSQEQFYKLVESLEKDSLISANLRSSYDKQYKDLMDDKK